MVISLRGARKWWFWVKVIAALVILALILPMAISWVRHLMYSAATRPPQSEEVLTPAGSSYGQPAGFLSRLVRVLRTYYRGMETGT